MFGGGSKGQKFHTETDRQTDRHTHTYTHTDAHFIRIVFLQKPETRQKVPSDVAPWQRTRLAFGRSLVEISVPTNLTGDFRGFP